MNFTGHFQSFLVHFNELRRRLVRILLLFVIATLVCYSCVGSVLPWIIKPAGHLIFTTPLEAFSAHMTLAAIMGFLVTLPWTLYQLWGFISVALRPEERKLVYIFGPLSFVFFLLGVSFAFFVAVPMTYRFLMSFSSPYMQPMITVSSYMGFLANMLISFGITFELPLILAFLAKIGIATPEYLRQKRRHAIMILLIIATIVTPPDVISQVLLAVPLIILYEVGIIMVRFTYKHKTL